MARYLNQTLYKKSYMLEFSEGVGTKTVFTFSVPPQAEDFSFPQRINETKTFGGSVFDDYGNDIVKITLSGTTINNELKIIYTNPGEEYKTGEEEIFKLRDMIRDFGKRDKLGNKKIYLYSLSNPTFKTWEVVINELQIKRSKDMPFTYNYTLTMQGFPETQKKYNEIEDTNKSIFRRAKEWLENQTKDIVNKLKEWKKNLEDTKFFTYYKDLMDLYEQVSKTLDDLESAVSNLINSVAGYANSVANTFTETFAVLDKIIAAPTRLFRATQSITNSVKNVQLAVLKVEQWFEDFAEDKKEMYEEIWDAHNQDMDDIKDMFRLIAYQNVDATNKYVANVAQMVGKSDLLVVPGQDGEDDTIIETTGELEYTCKSTDTWDSLALKYYGDASMGVFLQYYNATLSNDSSGEIKAGKKIYIPTFENAQSMINNKVYNSPDTHDNYGNDLKIGGDLATHNGDLATHNGDLATSSSIENLSQAIESRLGTSVTNRIRNFVYGIRSTVGSDPTITNAYIINSIQSTLLADPRILSIDSISYEGVGDNLSIKIEYTDINKQKQTFGGMI